MKRIKIKAKQILCCSFVEVNVEADAELVLSSANINGFKIDEQTLIL